MELPDAHHEEVMDRANPEGGDKRTRLTVREVKEWVRDLTTQEVKSPRAGRRKDEPEQETEGRRARSCGEVKLLSLLGWSRRPS